MGSIQRRPGGGPEQFALPVVADAQGIVHRDLKPANIMLDEHGEVRISVKSELLREKGIQELSSRLKRWMRRKKWTPHCLSLPATYRIDLKGMAISTK